MQVNEEAMRDVMEKEVLNICYISDHAYEQVKSFIYNGASLETFDDETKKELSRFFNIIKHAYYLKTNEVIPNIFWVDEGMA